MLLFLSVFVLVFQLTFPKFWNFGKGGPVVAACFPILQGFKNLEGLG
jgi:hypothetical protein